MTNEELQKIIAADFANSEVVVKEEQGKYSCLVISDEFTNMSELERQKRIYAPITKLIASGEIHALSVKGYSKEEWEKLAK